MSTDTRSRFIATARRHFSERGFDGTSIAAIADDVGLTKQALLHHFGSKEKLYGLVLEEISSELMAGLEQLDGSEEDPYQALESLLVERVAGSLEATESTRILMRELLDNRRRAESAGVWYLKPYLDRLTALVKANQPTAHLSDAQALACVYQFLGAVNYLVISAPTLSNMYGKRYFNEMKRSYPETLRALVRAQFCPEG